MLHVHVLYNLQTEKNKLKLPRNATSLANVYDSTCLKEFDTREDTKHVFTSMIMITLKTMHKRTTNIKDG